MESIRCGEALVRSSQPLLSFLAPAAHRTPSISPIARHCRTQRSQWQASRALTTTHRRRQQSAAAEVDHDPPEPSSRSPSTAPSSHGSVSDDLSSMLDDTLDLNKRAPTAPESRTTRFDSPNAQTGRSRDVRRQLEEARRDTARSTDDILKGLTLQHGARRQIARPQYSVVEPFEPNAISRMLDPYGNQNDAFTPAPPKVEESPPMRLGPTIGRTVNVDTARGMDVGRAFRNLEMLCARNSVRKDSMRQRFHERPGLKRKRLKSERWRKNFKASFKETVALVQKMRKQGW